MLSIKQLTLLPINKKLRLRDMMFRKDINQTELNEINCKYDFTISSIDELDNYLPCKYTPKKNIIDDEVKLLHKIHTLDLSSCQNITDESVKLLGGLHTLYLNNCNNITDESVKLLGDLYMLDLSCCQNITDESVKMLGGLHKLNLNDCKNITDAGIISLVKRNNENV